jgi:hypothetical protein
MHRVSYVFLVLRTAAQNKKTLRSTSCLWSDPASKTQILDVCAKEEERAIGHSIGKHQHMHHGLLKRTAVVSPRTPVP